MCKHEKRWKEMVCLQIVRSSGMPCAWGEARKYSEDEGGKAKKKKKKGQITDHLVNSNGNGKPMKDVMQQQI